MLLFSVVIAARNAAATLSLPLASLRQHTYSDWEAIVVDDGSVDDTAALVQREAQRDRRVRLISASTGTGVSAARNDGIAAAIGDWLLFLDADDSIFPDALNAWRHAIQRDPALDAVCGRWVRVAPDGRVVLREQWPVTRDMFPTFACFSVFPIHSCVVRRSAVVAAGGFDSSFITCEDWDLWQRVARAGANFGAVDAEVARYHMRPGSASLAAAQMLRDGLRVITTGHSPDPRVSAPLGRYATGLVDAEAAAVRFAYACWPAGLVLGSGDEAEPLLDDVHDDAAPRLDPSRVADAIFRSATLPLCTGPEGWSELWPGISSRLSRFLARLEERTRAPLLARRIMVALGRLLLQRPIGDTRLARVGATMLHVVDITEPAASALAPDGADRAVVRVQAGLDFIGWLELPVCDRQLDAAVVDDAIAHEYGWAILGRFFEATVYREIVRRRGRAGTEAVRKRVVVGSATATEDEWPSRRHEMIGWTVFLQELWGHPDWPQGAFYDGDRAERHTTRRTAVDGWISIDVLDSPSDWTVSAGSAHVELTIAGVGVCCIEVPAERGVIRASRLRALLTTAAGVELVHVAVREGLLGVQWESGTLRDHLSRRRSSRDGRADASVTPVSGLSPSAARRLEALRRVDGRWAAVGARKYGPTGSAASRRVALPASVSADVFDAAAVAGEPVFAPPTAASPEQLRYLPELLWAGSQQSPPTFDAEPAASGSPFGRHHFEALFAGGADPWRYTTPYEARKYEQTLSLLPPPPVRRALEIGCAEGHFTEVLARRVESLVASDISAIALERAAARCRGHNHVSFTRLDLTRDPLPGGNDVIVCSEVMYYVPRENLPAICRKLRDALSDGGRLITAHVRIASDEPDGEGYLWQMPFGVRTIREALRATPGLQLSRELRTRLYSVMEFERTDRRRTPVILEADFVMPQPAVADTISWKGGAALPPPAPPGAKLPILMYHRITADSAEGAQQRYRLHPKEFARQLAYLRDAGFRSASLAEWTTAIQTRKPLSGRPVALTFDDAYEDFAESALPLLTKYGFRATLFVVSSHVGGENVWDAASGDRARLMNWAAIQRAAAEGTEIGAHSATHPALTCITPAEIVREASRARSDIQRRIQAPVTTFAYPYGDTDGVVEHLVGGCGFVTAVTSRFGVSALQDRPMRLPRVEITGTDSLTDFIRKMGS